MPTLLDETEIRLQFSDIESRVHHQKQHNARSAGVHLMSGIIRPVLIESGILTPLDKEQLDDEMPLRMAIGMACEDWFVGLWPHLIWQPGELKLDGVIGSPDGVTLDGGEIDSTLAGETVDEEWKATWCSRRTYGKDIQANKSWMWQFAGYLKMLKCRFVRCHVLWVCGDYKQGPPSPMYVTYLLEFSQEEIDRFWTNVVLKNKKGAPREAGSK